MKYDISQIKKSLIDIAEAITSVLKLDLTIVNQERERIVATGRYQNKIGERVSGASVFSYALNNKKSFIIKEPKKHPACLNCSKKGLCEEHAEVCVPIIIGKQVIGVIGLIAFDEKQRQMILKNDESILNFLDKMADLIATKMIEEDSRKRLVAQSEEVEFLFNAFSHGIISLNEQLEVLKFNHYAKKIFKSIKKGMKMTDVIDISESLLFENHEISHNNPFTYLNKQYVFTKKPITDRGRIIEIVLEIKEMTSLIDTVNDIIGDASVIKLKDIIGSSQALKTAKTLAKKASKSSSTVLIQGESGVGKELFARAIHYESIRKNKAFVAINCAALPESLIESELFGYAEGSFTGARKSGRIGKFELANNGTIFLDEIGDLPIHLQSKLLRVIQEREVRRLGSNQVIKIDTRIIAATNQDLELMVKNKAFREDLYYRLNVIPLEVPPLNHRREDIKELTDYFLNKYNEKLGKSVHSIDEKALEMFKDFSWQGNVRELENTIEYAINMAEGYEIKAHDLPDKFRAKKTFVKEIKLESLETLEKKALKKALNLYGKSPKGYKKAYKALGISRATFYRKLKKYELK